MLGESFSQEFKAASLYRHRVYAESLCAAFSKELEEGPGSIGGFII